jgi:hypothetical protein
MILESTRGSRLFPARAKEAIESMSSALSYGASGGNRSDAVANAIGERIRVIATESGFPENTSQVARSKFDREVAIDLASYPGLFSGEALRDDVWSYLATVVLPDVVSWRFPDLAPHRFQGGVRNALQRLWMRGITLDRGVDHADRWGLVRSLSEDAAVQIFERASISGSRRLAIAIAESWAQMAEERGRGNMEPVMRRATKLIRLKNEIVDLGGLSEDELASLITSIFGLAWESFHSVPTDSTR